MRLMSQPITFAEARAFIVQHHRHHLPPVGCKACVGVTDGERVVGVAVVGRPVARAEDDGWTAEITRTCVLDGVRNAGSAAMGAGIRLAHALGYKRVITRTMIDESGVTLRAVGMKRVKEYESRSWDAPGRPRVDKHPLGQKILWEIAAQERAAKGG